VDGVTKTVDDVLSTPRKVKESVDNTVNTGKSIVDGVAGAFSLIAGGFSAVANAVQGAQELVAKVAPPAPPPKAPAPKAAAPKAAAKKEIDPAEAQKADFKAELEKESKAQEASKDV
ncbi:unnamed protein product, partial [Symbiodinium sp. CCMP2456]